MDFLAMNSTSGSYYREKMRACKRTPAIGSTASSYLPSSSRHSKSGSPKVGVTSSGSSPSTGDSCVFLALTAGRGEARAEVGMAAIDLRTPCLILCQISDCQTYASTLAKIYVFDPALVLMPATMCNHSAGKNELYRLIRNKFVGLSVTSISRIHFNESAGLERIRTLCATGYSSVELFVKGKYYALAAAAALLKYVEYIQRLPYAPNSMKIEFQGPQDATTIDMESARSLELVASQSGQRNASLLGALNHCSTPMGRKLLRANILQPPCEERVILERQSSVTELVTDPSLRAVLQPVIRLLYGAEKLLGLPSRISRSNNVQTAEKNLNYILLLKNSLDIVPELRAVLANAKTTFFRRVRQNLENPEFRAMRDNILRVIHPDARSLVGYTSSNMQRCFAIKPKVNDLLDVARQTYCELIDDMKCMVERLATKYKLALSLGCNATLGYHIQAVFPRNSNVQCSDLPAEFIEVRKKRGSFTMTTKMLLVLSQQCKTASEEVQLMSNLLLCDLLRSTRERISCLFQLSADVAELDLIVSLARVSSIAEYARPTFGSRLILKDCTHPVMELSGFHRPTPNDVRATVPLNFHLITGPNMSGKSTYLKQIVLLQIMAQIGCYVPAREAEFRIADRIFCKISLRDEIESNASTFVLEIKEVRYILDSLTANSLVILDELCSGTTLEEGASLAWAICEQLLITPAFTFVATHFFHLTKMAELYYNVTNHKFETVTTTAGMDSSDQARRLIYTYRLKLGTAPTSPYGIALAELSLPKAVTQLARKFASMQSDDVTTAGTAETVARESLWMKSCYTFVAEMYDLIETDQFNRKNICHIAERIYASENQGKPSFARMRETGRPFAVPKDISEDVPKDVPRGTECLESEPAESLERRESTMASMLGESSIDRFAAFGWVSASPAADVAERSRRILRERRQTHRAEATSEIDSRASTIVLENVAAVRSPNCLANSFTNVPSYVSETGSREPRRVKGGKLVWKADSDGDGNGLEIDAPEELCNVSPSFHGTCSFPSSTSFSVVYTPQTELPEFHEYCLSDDELRPSGSLANWCSVDTVAAETSALEKELRIFRQIEGSAFDGREFAIIDVTDDRADCS